MGTLGAEEHEAKCEVGLAQADEPASPTPATCGRSADPRDVVEAVISSRGWGGDPPRLANLAHQQPALEKWEQIVGRS